MDNIFWAMGIIAILAILISWSLSCILAAKIADPIKKLKNASAKIIEGEYNHKVNIKSGDEIEELAISFNQASQSIQKYIGRLQSEKQKQKEFLDNVTHEFKTPLTAIIGYAELIPRLQDAADVDASIAYIQTEGERLLKLVNELLTLSRLGQSEFTVCPQIGDLRHTIEQALRIAAPRLAKYDIGTKTRLIEAEAVFDKDKTKQVLLNIIDNAIKYSECSYLTLTMAFHSGQLEVCIYDDGIGMSESMRQEAFDPLLKRGCSRGGNGLGLCICHELMRKQKGEIIIFPAPGGGTLVRLLFATIDKR